MKSEKVKPKIDFRELAAYPPGQGLEALARQLGELQELAPEWTGIGPDRGKDLIFKELHKGKLTSVCTKWLVQCKDKSESGDTLKELGPNFSIKDKLLEHGCGGFLLITTTCIGSNLKQTLDAINSGGQYKTLVWDQFELTKLLLDDRHKSLFKQYFPRSFEAHQQAISDRSTVTHVNSSGAFLGKKSWYRYTGNEGKDYKFQTFDYLAEAAGLEKNDTFEMMPRGMKPRHVILLSKQPAADGTHKRKKLVVQLCNWRQISSITVAGMEMQAIASIGEKSRRGKNSK